MLTEASGQVSIEVPQDREGVFRAAGRSQAAATADRVDEIVLSLYAKGLTTGEISAHFAEIYGA